MRPAIALTSLAFLLTGCFGGLRPHSHHGALQGRYDHLLHDQFYRAWRQPKVVAVHRAKISVPVDVQINSQGRVVRFQTAKSSGHPAIDASIAAVGRKVKRVLPPPFSLPDRRYDLRIYFELDVKR